MMDYRLVFEHINKTSISLSTRVRSVQLFKIHYIEKNYFIVNKLFILSIDVLKSNSLFIFMLLISDIKLLFATVYTNVLCL